MKYIKPYIKIFENQDPKGNPGKIYFAYIQLNRLQAFVNKANKLKLKFFLLNINYEATVAIIVMTEETKNNNFKRYPYFYEDNKTVAHLMKNYENIPIEDVPNYIENFEMNKKANKYNL